MKEKGKNQRSQKKQQLRRYVIFSSSIQLHHPIPISVIKESKYSIHLNFFLSGFCSYEFFLSQNDFFNFISSLMSEKHKSFCDLRAAALIQTYLV